MVKNVKCTCNIKKVPQQKKYKQKKHKHKFKHGQINILYLHCNYFQKTAGLRLGSSKIGRKGQKLKD